MGCSTATGVVLVFVIQKCQNMLLNGFFFLTLIWQPLLSFPNSYVIFFHLSFHGLFYPGVRPSPPSLLSSSVPQLPISNSCKCAYIFPLCFVPLVPPHSCLPPFLSPFISSALFLITRFLFLFLFRYFYSKLVIISTPPPSNVYYSVVLYNRVFWILLTTTQISFVYIYILYMCHVIFLFEIHKNFHSCRFPTLSIIVVQVSVKSLY